MSTNNPIPDELFWLCPLYTFSCDCESVNLAKGIEIRPAPTCLKDYIRERYGSEARHDLSEFGWAAFLPHHRRNLEGLSIEKLASIGYQEWDRARDSLVDLITALRLYQEGRLVAGLLISATFHNSEWSIGGETIWTSVSSVDFFEEEPVYELQKSDIPKVDCLLLNIRKWRKDGILDKIKIALQRFHSAYHGNIEDRLIDQMIAFESLYLGNEQELTYRLALRTAFLLDKDKNAREAIFSDMKKAYDLRSKIVHGDNPPNGYKLGVIVPKTKEYLRQSIRKFLLLLSKGKSLKEIREKLLDENIIENGETLSFRE